MACSLFRERKASGIWRKKILNLGLRISHHLFMSTDDVLRLRPSNSSSGAEAKVKDIPHVLSLGPVVLCNN